MERLITRMHSLSEKRKIVQISWISSHCGIKENECAGEAAKKAAGRLSEFLCVPYQNWYSIIQRKIYQLWESGYKEE